MRWLSFTAQLHHWRNVILFIQYISIQNLHELHVMITCHPVPSTVELLLVWYINIPYSINCFMQHQMCRILSVSGVFVDHWLGTLICYCTLFLAQAISISLSFSCLVCVFVIWYLMWKLYMYCTYMYIIIF